MMDKLPAAPRVGAVRFVLFFVGLAVVLMMAIRLQLALP